MSAKREKKTSRTTVFCWRTHQQSRCLFAAGGWVQVSQSKGSLPNHCTTLLLLIFSPWECVFRNDYKTLKARGTHWENPAGSVFQPWRWQSQFGDLYPVACSPIRHWLKELTHCGCICLTGFPSVPQVRPGPCSLSKTQQQQGNLFSNSWSCPQEWKREKERQFSMRKEVEKT